MAARTQRAWSPTQRQNTSNSYVLQENLVSEVNVDPIICARVDPQANLCHPSTAEDRVEWPHMQDLSPSSVQLPYSGLSQELQMTNFIERSQRRKSRFVPDLLVCQAKS